MAYEARTLTENNAEELAAWCGGMPVVQHDALDHEKTTTGVNVPTKNGVERAQVGDAIYRQDNGNFGIFKHQR